MIVHSVKHARRRYRCGKNDCLIHRGDPYYWFKPRYGGKRIRCAHHYPRTSEMVSSDKLATLYATSEDLEDLQTKLERLNNRYSADKLGEIVREMAMTLHEAADDTEMVAEGYRESASNLEEHFSSSPQIDECNEKADACEQWQDALDSCASNADNLFDEINGLVKEMAYLPPHGWDEYGEVYRPDPKERAVEILDEALQGFPEI